MQQDKLEGQLFAIAAALRAILKLQPDVNAASKAVLAELEQVIAIALAKSLSDEFVAGIAAAKSSILPTKKEMRRGR